ncbi:MAG: right-handed parallel beta-helix repeat-containing protein [Planctomycetes bacterium]|nr:right-handed parallel beta-helix repeat-containing protein [Planctomycetota bacterium]
MLLPLLLSASCFIPQGNTIIVPDDYAFIQDAINATSHGDEVLVRAGTYFESNLQFSGKAITLISEKGAHQTTIDGMSSGSVFAIQGGEGPGTVIDGFTVTNGIAWDGGGISVLASPTTPSSPTIQNCIIENNIGSGGGGVLALRGSLSLVKNCLIQNNSTTHYHGAGVVIFDSSPVFDGCTIRNNQAAGGGGGFAVWDASTSLLVINSILSGNTPTNIDRYNTPQILAEYSLCEGDSAKWWFGTGCIDADPLFAAGPAGDHYLSQTAAGQTVDSPCVDAADPGAPLYGTTRTDSILDQGTPDMGFHEPGAQPTLAVANLIAGQTATVTLTNFTPSSIAYFAYSVAGGGPTSGPFGDVNLSPPWRLIPLATDASGVATMSSLLPPTATGLALWLHAADPTMGVMSNSLALIVG